MSTIERRKDRIIDQIQHISMENSKRRKRIDELEDKNSEFIIKNKELEIVNSDMQEQSRVLQEQNLTLQQCSNLLQIRNEELIGKLAIQDNKIHFLNNKMKRLELSLKECSKDLEIKKLHLDNTIQSSNHDTNKIIEVLQNELSNKNQELEQIMMSNTYKVWIRYKRLPEGIRKVNRALFTPFKVVFKVIRKLKRLIVKSNCNN